MVADAVAAVIAVIGLGAAFPAVAGAQGLDVIGKSNLGGGGQNGEVAVVGDTAIVGSGLLPGAGTRSGFYNPLPCPPNKVKIVDLSRPSAPAVRATIDVPVGVTAFDVDALRVRTPSFTGDLAAVALVSCGTGASTVDRGVAYYDVSNPSSPRFLGRYDADAETEDPADPPCPNAPSGDGSRCASSQHQVKLVQRPDGKVLSLSTEPFASASGTTRFPSGDLRIVDVTNPASPTQVGSWPLGEQQPPKAGTRPFGFSPNGCRPFDAGYGPGVTPDGSRALLAYLDQGLLTVDISNPFAPTGLGQLDPYGERRDLEGNAAYVNHAAAAGREFALVGESDWIAPETRVRIDSPASLAGSKYACEAMFTLFDPEDTAQIYRKPGSQVPAAPAANAPIAYVGVGCGTNPYITGAGAPDVSGKIVFRDRGRVLETGTAFCSIAESAKRAQEAGAIGMVLAQTSTSAPEAFSPDGDPTGLTIPVVMLDKPESDALRTTLCPTYTAPVPAGPGGTCSGGQPVSGALVDRPDPDGGWGALRRIDITNPGAPSAAGEYLTPRAKQFPPPDLGVYSAHHAVARGNRAFAAWNSDGLRVLDIAGASLTEVASFVPPDTPDPTNTIPDKAYVTGVDLTPTGDIVITDINSGLYVLRTKRASTPTPTPAPAAGVAAFAGCPSLTANLIRGSAAGGRITGTVRGDRIFGGTGNDIVDGLAGDDCIDLGPGTDSSQGGLGNDLMLGGLGEDRMAGSAGNDRVRGGSSTDRINGGFGNDALHGQSGKDRVSGSRGRDKVNGGSSNDVISAGSSNDRVAGDQGHDRINGNSGNDLLRGNSGNDRIKGSTGADRISGGSGNDLINARDGRRDRVNCGRGRDSVVADRFDRIARNCDRVRRS